MSDALADAVKTAIDASQSPEHVRAYKAAQNGLGSLVYAAASASIERGEKLDLPRMAADLEVLLVQFSVLAAQFEERPLLEAFTFALLSRAAALRAEFNRPKILVPS